jgi:SAM-dependent methyltransferase
MSTDSEWEEWGRREPYFGVITDPKYRRSGMTEEARREFFESGRVHAEYVMAMIHRHIDAHFRPRSIVDFGCGVGRLLVSFASFADDVVGLDVSPSMLAEARRNCDAQGARGVRLLASDDALSALEGRFDLIHSFIVFQHIAPERGRALFGELLGFLAPGGVGAIHFSYSKSRYADTHGIAPAPPPEAAPAAAPVPAPAPAPAPEGAPLADPEMQMNPYNANEVLFTMQRAGVRRFHAEFTDHGGELGAFLFFQRPVDP